MDEQQPPEREGQSGASSSKGSDSADERWPWEAFVDPVHLLENGATERSYERHGRRTGTVKWFSEEKGYGFIESDAGSEDLLVHHTGIVGTGFRSLEEGARVTYEVASGRRLQAENVRVI
jgi:CspA family cold shock protein